MTNEDIVKAIQNSFNVTENMQWLYQEFTFDKNND